MKYFSNHTSLIFSVIVAVVTLFSSCGSDPTCTDGIQNQGETGIDCFVNGTINDPCPPCELVGIPIDTSDNQIETPDVNPNNLSCTGNANMCALVNQTDWISTSATGNTDLAGLTISGVSSNGSTISLNYIGSLETGTFDFDLGNSADYGIGANVFSTDFAGNGSITIDGIDTTNKVITGTFQFIAYDLEVVDSVVISDGKFINLEY